MEKPKISFIGPSHRTHMWHNFYSSIVTNLDFEVVFVTDKEPKDEEVPDALNFKWIYSTVKPAQCFEIAYRNSTGNFIIWTGDDYYYSPYAIDNVYTMYRSFYDHRVIISFRIHEDGGESTHTHAPPWDGDVQLTTSGLISKRAIEEAGGLADTTFQCGHWDVDLMFRIFANGGRIFICPTAAAYEAHQHFHQQEARFASTWQEELNYLTDLWRGNPVTDNPRATHETLKKRKHPFKPYTNENILTVNQGKVGGFWK